MDLIKKRLQKELSGNVVEEQPSIEVDTKEKLAAFEKQQQQLKSTVQDKERQISRLEDKLEQFELKKEKELSQLKTQLSETHAEKENLLRNVISTKFKALVENVKSLRAHRVNLSDISDIFPPTLQSIIDLYNNSDDVISLTNIQQYESIQIEQDSLKVQMGFIEQCNDKNELNELVEERDFVVRKCVKNIRLFLKHVLTLPLEKRERELTDALEYIRNNYPDMRIIDDDSQQHDSQMNMLEKSVVGYKSENVLKMKEINAYRQASNHHSSKLFKLIGELQRESHCVISVQSTGTQSDDSDNIDDVMKRYQDAILLEMKDTKVVRFLF